MGKNFKVNANQFLTDNVPKKVKFKVPQKRLTIIQICCGFQHCLALTNKHKVYGWGHDIGKGQIGIVPDNTMFLLSNPGKYTVPSPMLNTFLSKSDIIFISCGYNDSLCIDSNLMCYVFGSTAFETFKKGQNPHHSFQRFRSYYNYNNRNRGDFNKYFNPYKFDKDFIKDGCCGFNNTALLTVNNEVVVINPSHGVQRLTNKDIGLLSNQIIEKVVAGYENTIIIAT